MEQDLQKKQLSAIASILISAAIAIAAISGYNVLVVQPALDSQPTASRAVGDTTFTNVVTTGDATVGGNLNVTGSAAITGGYTTGTGTEYEGTTADAFETTLAVTDPTADRTVTLPNATGTVVIGGAAYKVVTGIATTATSGYATISHGLSAVTSATATLCQKPTTTIATASAIITGTTVTVHAWANDFASSTNGASVCYTVIGTP